MKGQNAQALAALLGAVASWIGVPRLGFLMGCAADASVHVPGEQLFWMVLLLPPISLFLLYRGLKQEQKASGGRLVTAAFLLALCSFGAMANLYWQYSHCEAALAEMFAARLFGVLL